jgi:hypothetical protein
MATTATASAAKISNSSSSNNKRNSNATSYSLLKQKIKKVGKILENLKKKNKGEDNKEYRAYTRKQENYYKQLYKTGEYKEKKLQSALDNLHEVLSSSSEDNDASSSSSSSSGSSSSSSSDEELSVDRTLIQKKYGKVTNLLEKLESDHGNEGAKSCKDYQTYHKKQQQYFETLAKNHPEWVRQQQILQARRRAEAEATRLEEEQRRRVEEVKAGERAKLEAQKQAIRDKIRKEGAAREEVERLKEQAYEIVKRAEDNAARKTMQKLDEEAAKRGKEFNHMLHVQEDLGIIKIGKNASA